jgi:chloramphenicol 3-O-phosphotransferase
MADFIIIGGAPGSGKTTVSERLRTVLAAPLIDFGSLRVFHLDPTWSNASPTEEAMAFENLLFILQNYARHGYTNVIVNDLRDHRIQQLPTALAGYNFVIVTLVVTDDAVLAGRVRNPERDSGFRDVAAALDWNRDLLQRPPVENEHKLDNTLLSIAETVRGVQALIERDTAFR